MIIIRPLFSLQHSLIIRSPRLIIAALSTRPTR